MLDYLFNRYLDYPRTAVLDLSPDGLDQKPGSEKTFTYPKFQTVTAGNTRGNTKLFAKQGWHE